jgi:hypothetical protein
MEFQNRASALARAARTPAPATMSVSQEEMDADNALKKMNSNFGVRSYVIMNDAGAFRSRSGFERLPLWPKRRLLSRARFLHSHKRRFAALFFVFSGIPLKYNGVENPAALQICALSSELLKKCGKFVKSHDEVCPASVCRTPSHLLLLDLFHPCNWNSCFFIGRWPVECLHVIFVSASHLIELALIVHSFFLPACPFRQRDDLVVLRLRTKKGEYIMTPGRNFAFECPIYFSTSAVSRQHWYLSCTVWFWHIPLNETLDSLYRRPHVPDEGFSMVVMQDPNYIEPIVVAPVAGAPGSEAK